MEDLRTKIREIRLNLRDNPNEDIDEILSLFSKLVDEAKPRKVDDWESEKDIYMRGIYKGHNEAIDQYESNLKKLLGKEVKE